MLHVHPVEFLLRFCGDLRLSWSVLILISKQFSRLQVSTYYDSNGSPLAVNWWNTVYLAHSLFSSCPSCKLFLLQNFRFCRCITLGLPQLPLAISSIPSEERSLLLVAARGLSRQILSVTRVLWILVRTHMLPIQVFVLISFEFGFAWVCMLHESYSAKTSARSWFIERFWGWFSVFRNQK